MMNTFHIKTGHSTWLCIDRKPKSKVFKVFPPYNLILDNLYICQRMETWLNVSLILISNSDK